MRVIVVGAGIAGLGAAFYFARKGHDVQVLEGSHRVGGRAVTLTSRRGDRVDAGTQYFHTNYVRVRALLDELGLASQLATILGKTRFFDRRTSRGYFDVSHRLPWFPPAGLRNVKGLWLLSKALSTRTDAFSLGHAARLDETDAWHATPDPFMREFALRPLLLAGSLAEPAAAKASLLHVLRLFRIVVLTGYQVLPSGIAAFAGALAARLRVSREVPVRRLLVERDAAAGVELGNGQALKADHVVIAVPPPAAAALLPDEWVHERRYLEGITIPPFALVSFFLERPLERGLWSYMLPQDEVRHVSFITDAARKSPAMVTSGNSVLQAWTCFPASQRLRGLSETQAIELCRGDVECFFPGFSSWIEEAYVTYHPCAVPFHPVGHQSRTIEFLRAVESRKHVSFCGDYMSGGFMEAALWSAERAAHRNG